MNNSKLKSYLFSTEAQWDTCLFNKADRDSRRTGGGIRPLAPYAQPAKIYPSSGAHAPVVTGAGEILWCDDKGAIHRLSTCGDVLQACKVPPAITCAKRIAGTSSGLWLVGEPTMLECYADDTFTRRLTVDLSPVQVTDLANDGQGGVSALVHCDELWQVFRIDRFGHLVAKIELIDVSQAVSFVYLRRSQRFVVLTGGRYPRLCWFSREGGSPRYSVPIKQLRRCLEAHSLGSNLLDRVFVVGADAQDLGGQWHVVFFDADSNPLGEVPLDKDGVTGITANRDSLLVTGKRGLLRFGVAETVPETTKTVECQLATPVLFSPDRPDRRRWLRIEATANLPPGCTLEIKWAATDDESTRDRLRALADDDLIPPNVRIAKLLSDPELRSGRTVFHGTLPQKTEQFKAFSAKLFDVNQRYVWAFVTLAAAPGARLPRLKELAVLYPGRTLMENLPSIYQREEDRPESYLRTLVGVLETTTQDLDARIAALGRHVHPATAEKDWLDYLARWLGVPWDDALAPEQKRALLSRSPELAKSRGTRVGLETLLECLIPGPLRRFRVTDATADFGFACVGSGSSVGSQLPAILAGSTCATAELGSTALLGKTRLASEEAFDDGTSQLVGLIRVDVAATAAERAAWEPWLQALITEMIPLATRLELQWVATQALRSSRLGSPLKIEPDLTARLGTDAIIGLAHLEESAASLSASSPQIGIRLV